MAILPASALAIGCGGLNASKAVSPATFLLPGGFLLKADPQPAPAVDPITAPEPASTPVQGE